MTAFINETVYTQTLVESPPHLISDDASNKKAIAMLEKLASIENPTPEQQAVAEIIVTLIQSYEKRYATEPASPRAVLVELMAANDLKQKELVPEIASKGVLSEIIHGRREISKKVALKLAARFSVSHTLFL